MALKKKDLPLEQGQVDATDESTAIWLNPKFTRKLDSVAEMIRRHYEDHEDRAATADDIKKAVNEMLEAVL